MMGRRELEAALVAARAEEGLRDRRVELIDVGAVAVLVEDGADGTDGAFQRWLERAPHSSTIRSTYDTATLAEEALTGVAPAGPVSLGPPITVWFGDPARFPTLPVMLGRDTPRCRP